MNGITFFDDDHSGIPPMPTRIEQRGNYVGLHCGYVLRIQIKDDFPSVDLVYREGGGIIEAFDSNNKQVFTAHAQNTHTPSSIRVAAGKSIPIKCIEIRSANEMFLLKVNPNKSWATPVDWRAPKFSERG